MDSIIEMKNIVKKYKGFELNVPEFKVPAGFATALIGENGAGKTTLLDIMAGVNLDFKGEINYFGKYANADDGDVRERIGYTASNSFFMPHWKVSQVSEVCSLLFESFDRERFEGLLEKMSLKQMSGKKVSELSDGNKMRLMLASVFARRDTKVLMMDEPASPLDPVMRDTLCDMIREYLSEENDSRSVVFSTHNISDMESVTDYAVIAAKGRIAEQGFTDDLKEKYVSVKGEAAEADKAKRYMLTFSQSKYGFEGICLADNLDKLAGLDIKTEYPGLHQISVAVMKANM
ncbi:MAG: ABC transporter ATP-binding protein [Ruminococcus sp.]|nr:ABC transporter ATP-binding protein [Ruminococcus sp.]